MIIRPPIFSPLSKQEKALVAAYSLLNMLLLGALESLMLASTFRRDTLMRGAAGMNDIAAVVLSIVVTSLLVGLFMTRNPRFTQPKGINPSNGKRLQLTILSITIFGVACGLPARALQGPVVIYPHISIAALCCFLYGWGFTALNRSRVPG